MILVPPMHKVSAPHAL